MFQELSVFSIIMFHSSTEGKARSLLTNIKIKAVMNKNIFYAIFRFISLNHFQAKLKKKLLVLRIWYFDETFSSFLDELKRH